MIKNYLAHKRNTSQSIKIQHKPKIAAQEKAKKFKTALEKNKSTTLALVEKSTKKQVNKHTVIEQLDEPQQTKPHPFFAFGQRIGGHKNWNLNMDKIAQVQDSSSRRDFTSHRSARQHFANCEKQNFNTSNIEEGFKRVVRSKSNKHKSKQKSNKTRNQKSKSTISLSRVKNNSKQLELRTQKMEKSVKMLWECMGQLWESSRVSQYRSEKNNESINTLKRKLEEQEQKILEIKFEISKAQKNNEKLHMGLRA